MEAELNTIFRWCNDVEPMRDFYSDCFGLTETFYRNDEEHGWLTYQLGQVQLVFTRASTPLPIIAEFAENPGYSGGSLKVESWVIKVERPIFDEIVQRLQASSYTLHSAQPTSPRPGALQLLALDPMGFTVEIYTEFDA